MSRPRVLNNPTAKAFYLTQELVDLLVSESNNTGIPQSVIVRKALQAYLTK